MKKDRTKTVEKPAKFKRDPLWQALKQNFGITGIPALVVCKADGTVVTKNARADVQTKGPQALQGWK